MREIKFRAWDKKENEHIYNVERTYDYRCRNCGAFEDSFGDVLDNDNYIVEQYTGLKDKNGVEIYEGDILSIYYKENDNDYGVGEVVYKNTAFITKNASGVEKFWVYDAEVIGNIHDNPELLDD